MDENTANDQTTASAGIPAEALGKDRQKANARIGIALAGALLFVIGGAGGYVVRGQAGSGTASGGFSQSGQGGYGMSGSKPSGAKPSGAAPSGAAPSAGSSTE